MASIRDADDKSESYEGDFNRLRQAAKNARERKPLSVVNKSETPPSGDKHDYLSYSRYWWPNPETANGLPYIRKDGKVNRHLVNRGDRNAIGDFVKDAICLSLADYFFDDKASGKRAREIIRVWFVDKATRMNPNLNYAQAVPGRSEGRGVGIIDTRGFIWMLDAVALLESTNAIDSSDLAALQSWFAEFLDWLLTNKLGKEERRKKNNHGSWYAALTSRIALFVDRKDLAREITTQVREDRIGSQIDEQGRQAEELVRTQPLHYSLFNLAALTNVARVGDKVGVEVWSPRMIAAVDYLEPYICGDKPSPHKQMKKLRVSDAEHASLLILSQQFDSESARRAFRFVPTSDRGIGFTRLLFPPVMQAP